MSEQSKVKPDPIATGFLGYHLDLEIQAALVSQQGRMAAAFLVSVVRE